MELKNMTAEELLERRTAIVAELDVEGADLDALEAEMRSINDELEARKAEAKKKAEIRDLVANGAGEVIVDMKDKLEERKTMTNNEVRSSEAYINAFADYLKSGDDTECRALLTETVSGTVPVPVLVEDIIRTAWEKDEILSRVKKTNFKGNVKIAFEKSADPAYEHVEGTTAPTEEVLVFGIVTMIPKNIKKWITISDEAIALGGEAFVRYIYDELTYQIVKKLAALVVADIAGLGTSSTATAPAAAKITEAPALTTIASALANLSDEATDPVIIMNRLTEAEFISAIAAGNFAFDAFQGLPRVYTSALPAYASADANAVYAIVGDLKGAQVNYPEGEGVVIKWDDLSLAEKDLVKVVGRQYAAHAVTANNRFTNIAKPSQATT